MALQGLVELQKDLSKCYLHPYCVNLSVAVLFEKRDNLPILTLIDWSTFRVTDH